MTYPYAYRILSLLSMISVPANAMFPKGGGDEKRGLAAALNAVVNPYIYMAAPATTSVERLLNLPVTPQGKTSWSETDRQRAGVYFKEIFGGKTLEETPQDILEQKKGLLLAIYKGELGLSDERALELLEFFKKHMTFQDEDVRLAAEISKRTYGSFKDATPPGGPSYNQEELAALTIERYEKELGFCTGKAIAVFKHLEEGKSLESGSLIFFEVDHIKDTLPQNIDANEEKLQEWVRQSPPPLPSMRDFMPDSSTSEEVEDAQLAHILQSSDTEILRKDWVQNPNLPKMRHAADEDNSDAEDMEEAPRNPMHGDGTLIFKMDLDLD